MMVLQLKTRFTYAALLESLWCGGGRRLDVGLGSARSEAHEEVLPGDERLARPHPEAGGDADDERHQVLDHEHLKVGLHQLERLAGGLRRRTRDRVRVVRLALLVVPREHPRVVEVLLVEEAAEHRRRRHQVQHREHADANHQLLQLVRLGAVVLHHGADAEQRHEARHQEDGAQDQVHQQRHQHKAPQRRRVPLTHRAHAAQNVTCENTRNLV